jgi:DNA uptake protein ComE-like DNA-binding protein
MRRVALFAPFVASVVIVAGCSLGSSDKTAAPAGSTPTSTTVASTSTTVPGATTTVPAATTKANANTASKAEITAALTAAGVASADRWAGEVVEYRPYATNDPTFAKLRQNLVKYNPAAGVVDQIVSALSL